MNLSVFTSLLCPLYVPSLQATLAASSVPAPRASTMRSGPGAQAGVTPDELPALTGRKGNDLCSFENLVCGSKRDIVRIGMFPFTILCLDDFCAVLFSFSYNIKARFQRGNPEDRL